MVMSWECVQPFVIIVIVLEDTKITNKAFVSHGKCTRIEETGDSLERLFNFTMSEIIFVGDEKYCEESISDCLGYLRIFLWYWS